MRRSSGNAFRPPGVGAIALGQVLVADTSRSLPQAARRAERDLERRLDDMVARGRVRAA